MSSENKQIVRTNGICGISGVCSFVRREQSLFPAKLSFLFFCEAFSLPNSVSYFFAVRHLMTRKRQDQTRAAFITVE